VFFLSLRPFRILFGAEKSELGTQWMTGRGREMYYARKRMPVCVFVWERKRKKEPTCVHVGV